MKKNPHQNCPNKSFQKIFHKEKALAKGEGRIVFLCKEK
jgi:hypothetical protein